MPENVCAAHALLKATKFGNKNSLAETLRNGIGPSSIVLAERDLVLAIGVIAANERYAQTGRVVSVGEDMLAQIASFTATQETGAGDTSRPAGIYVTESVRDGNGNP